MKLLTAEQMREVDRITIEDVGLPGIVLMENAAAGCVSVIYERHPRAIEAGVCVVCGTGNNGGDGFAIARHLWNTGYDVEIFLIGSASKVKGDAKINHDVCEKIGVPIMEVTGEEEMEILVQELDSAGLIVDALFGTGLTRDVEGTHRQVIEAINEAGTPVFAVDLPSGMHSDSGRPLGVCVYADTTGTLAMPKIGLYTHPGYLYTGQLYSIDISIPEFVIADIEARVFLTEGREIAEHFAPREISGHKGTYGHVLVVGGKVGTTGAPAMSSEAVLRSGAGLCSLAVPEGIHPYMVQKLNEVMPHPLPEAKDGGLGPEAVAKTLELLEGKTVLALGPGMGTSEAARKFMAELLPKVEVPMVIDADGLNNLADQLEVLRQCKSHVVLTPHPGEMSRLTGLPTPDVMGNRLAVASDFARKWGVTVVLKGARSVIASPEGEAWINPTGNPGMATAGTGDVLTGVVAGFLAQTDRAVGAVVAAVYVHGLAGDIAAETKGERGLIAGDLLDKLAEAVKEMEDEARPWEEAFGDAYDDDWDEDGEEDDEDDEDDDDDDGDDR
ncbi:MAG: NAD(P)H-hydrate dehydratase [Deltaproteobacteria bacterium]|nr:NAD(P)H-hydrate dehydratase [Deltaproteobacteria bacterium]MCB9478385.1 NAD(P)H-hydrate dehydratase [Deltaproteobacteria bacterium]